MDQAIFVVEGDFDIQCALGEAFEEEGWRPLLFRGAEEALEALERADPWFMVLDLRLPRMSGDEMLLALAGVARPASRGCQRRPRTSERWSRARGAPCRGRSPFDIARSPRHPGGSDSVIEPSALELKPLDGSGSGPARCGRIGARQATRERRRSPLHSRRSQASRRARLRAIR